MTQVECICSTHGSLLPDKSMLAMNLVAVKRHIAVECTVPEFSPVLCMNDSLTTHTQCEAYPHPPATQIAVLSACVVPYAWTSYVISYLLRMI